MRRNVSGQNVAAQMNSRSDGSPITSGVSVFVTGDGGTQSSGGGTLTHKGNGHWNYTPTQAETNYAHIAFTFVHSSGVNQTINVYTVSFDPHDTTRLGLSALPNAAAGGSGGLPTADANNAVRVQSGTGTGQLDLSSGRVRLQDGTIARATFAADSGLQTIRSGTAQAGAAGSITLDAGASSTTDFYVGAWILLTGGTGAGQARLITAYNGSTKVATVAPNWATNPDNTSTFAILPAAHVAGVHGNVTGSVASVTNRVTANVDQVDGQTLGAHGTGMFPADVRQFGGAAGAFSGGRPEVNTTHFGGAALTQTGGRPEVNTTHFGGAALTQSGGRPEVNTTHFGGVALTQSGGRPEVNVTHVAGTAQTARDLGDMLDAKVSTRLAPTVAGRTLNVTSGGRAGVNLDDTEGALAKGTEITGFNDLSAANVADAVWNAATASYGSSGSYGELVEARLDVAVGSRLAASAYTAPDNSGIAAIKAKTDKLTFDTSDRVHSRVEAMANDVITAATIASDAIDADAISADAGNEIADAILARDIGSGSGAGALNERTVRSALRFLRNRWTSSSGTLTVYKEDDSSMAWTSTLTETAGANPVTGSDPT